MLAQIYGRKHMIVSFRLGVIKFGCAQVFLANQTAGFLNWLYFKNKMYNWPDFLHGCSVLWKEKFDSIIKIGCGHV